MEKEANQLYRRPQMTGQARDEEEEEEFGGMGGASTTDALVEMIHRWSEATDKLDHYARVALLDFSKAFDLINHNILQSASVYTLHSLHYRPRPHYIVWGRTSTERTAVVVLRNAATLTVPRRQLLSIERSIVLYG